MNPPRIKNKNWFSENIVGIIACVFIVFVMVVYLLILTRTVKTTETTTITILGNTTNMLMLILGYYFVSSKTSKDKDKQIADLTEKKEESDKK